MLSTFHTDQKKIEAIRKIIAAKTKEEVTEAASSYDTTSVAFEDIVPPTHLSPEQSKQFFSERGELEKDKIIVNNRNTALDMDLTASLDEQCALLAETEALRSDALAIKDERDLIPSQIAELANGGGAKELTAIYKHQDELDIKANKITNRAVEIQGITHATIQKRKGIQEEQLALNTKCEEIRLQEFALRERYGVLTKENKQDLITDKPQTEINAM